MRRKSGHRIIGPSGHLKMAESPKLPKNPKLKKMLQMVDAISAIFGNFAFLAIR